MFLFGSVSDSHRQQRQDKDHEDRLAAMDEPLGSSLIIGHGSRDRRRFNGRIFAERKGSESRQVKMEALEDKAKAPPDTVFSTSGCPRNTTMETCMK